MAVPFKVIFHHYWKIAHNLFVSKYFRKRKFYLKEKGKGDEKMATFGILSIILFPSPFLSFACYVTIVNITRLKL